MGVAIGSFHGFGIVHMGLPPFIITLATLTALRGIGLLITNGSTINITNEGLHEFRASADFLGVPSLFWMVIVIAIPGYVFLHLSRWGRYLFAVGSNREAARLSGVNVNGMIYARLHPVRDLRGLRRRAACFAHRHRQRDAGGWVGAAGDRVERSSVAPASSAPSAPSTGR